MESTTHNPCLLKDSRLTSCFVSNIGLCWVCFLASTTTKVQEKLVKFINSLKLCAIYYELGGKIIRKLIIF